ncbi:MAG: DUF6261 family protein [Flavobacteriaceae bacterium]|nr:DUF6261 family protein [Flavobacteriaceae bacterium]
MIRPFYRNYRNGEFIRFYKDSIEILESFASKGKTKQLAYEKLLQHHQALNDAFLKVSGSSITKQIEALDDARDMSINGIQHVIVGYTNHFTPKTKEAAETLLADLKRYGTGIARNSYQQQTTILESICADWQQIPKLVKAVEQLQLHPWLSHMKATNEKFAAQYLNRVEDIAKNDKDSLLKLRAEATEDHWDLLRRLDALVLLDTPGDYVALQKRLDTLIKTYNQTVEMRGRGNTDVAELPNVDTSNIADEDLDANGTNRIDEKED